MSRRHVCNIDPPETYFCEEAPTLARVALAGVVLSYAAGVYLVGIGIAYLIEAARLWLLG